MSFITKLKILTVIKLLRYKRNKHFLKNKIKIDIKNNALACITSPHC